MSRYFHSVPDTDSFVAVLVAFLIVTGSAVAFVQVATSPAAASTPIAPDQPALEALGVDPVVPEPAAAISINDSALPGQFVTETVVGGLVQPVMVEFLPDGRMLLLQKGGIIYIVDPDTGQKEIYMQFPNGGGKDELEDRNEKGVTSIALDPNFEQNGYVYIYYTYQVENLLGYNQIGRFQHTENSGGLTSRASLDSEVVIWRDNEPWESCCHYGGGMGFGPDGKLYLTTGEEFDGDQAQNLSRAGGKIIRINSDGTVPSDNPFVDTTDALDEIYAYGLRNPYRATWDFPTGRFYIAEVGGNDNSLSYEDIHIGRKGANYGWPFCEGECADPAYDDPIYAYPHDGSGAAVTVGPVYRGNDFPSEYVGTLFYADYVRGWIKYLTFDSNGDVVSSTDFATGAGAVVDLEQGPNGELYLVDIYSADTGSGSVKRITYDTANDAPVIDSASATPTSGPSGQVVEFTASATDPNGLALTYTWTFGDGTTATGQTVQHTYTDVGVYNAIVEVSNGDLTTTSDPIPISIGAPPTAYIDEPADGTLFRAGDVITFSGRGVDPDEGDLSGTQLQWDSVFLHNEHTHPGTSDTGSSGSFTVSTSGHDYSSDTGYEITLTATDSDGLSDSTSVRVYPDKVDVTLDTNQTGLSVTLDTIPRTTPYTHDTVIGFNHQLSAPAEQCVDGTRYEFVSWSDGGARTHTYTVPETNAAVTANYRAAGACGDLPVTSGLALHLDSKAGVSTSGGAVTLWTDQSGNGNDLSTSGGPTLATSPSGAQAVRFDGVDDIASRTGGLTAVPTGNSDRTMFVVAEYRDVGYGGVAYGSPSTNDAFGLAVDPNGNLMVQGWGGANDYISTTPGTNTGWFTQSVVYENGAFTHYKDGTTIDSGTHSFTTTANRIVVGAEMTPAPYLDMDVAAVLIYDRALSETERQQVEAYLQQTYLGSEPTASVTISSPVEGETITGSDLTVSWDATAAQSGDHVHVTLDDQPYVGGQPLSGSYTFTDLAPGAHWVTVQVASTGHVVYTNPEALDMVNVTLEEATTNSAPVASDDSASVTQGASVTVDVLANDVDAENNIDPTAVQVTQYPASGTVIVDAVTGVIEYTHDGSASTSDSFAYTVDDDAGATSNVATVSVSITSAPPSSDLPVTSGLALHLDSEVGVTTSGSAVTTWADQSGNGNDLTASGGPTLATNPAGAQVVRFDGVDDVASRTGGLTGVPTGSADRTMFVVAEYRDVGYGGVAYGSPQTNRAFGLAVDPNGDLMIQGWGGANDYISTTAGTGAGWFAQSVVYENGAFTHYKDGTTIDSGTHTYQTTANRIVVGAEMTPAPYLDMDVAAVLIYDRALSETERQQVEAYLQQTYVDGTSPPPAEASVSITSPTDGAALTGSDLTVSWDGVEAASGDHVHLSLDDGPVVEDLPLSGTYTFSSVAEGGHTVTATVADSSHVSYTNPEATDSVTVTLEAATTNSAPVANDDSASVTQGESVVIDVLADDTDAENNIDPTTVQVVQFPTSGTVVVDAVTGDIEYTHDGSTSTSDSFTYTVDDDAGATSNEATVSVSIASTPPPSDLPVTSGLALHLDSEVGVTTSGGAVTTWADQSGNGNDLTTSGGPTLATSPTGAQVVRFDGVDDVASRTGGLTAVPTGSADRTMFVVAEYRDVGYGGVAYGSPQTNRAFGLSVDSNGDLMIQGWGGANDYISTTAGTGTGWFAQSVVYENGAFTHYKDGAAIDSGTHTFATTANRIVVGAEMTPAPYLDMDVAAVVIYDRALSETERQQVEAYLQQTYVGSGSTQTASVAISSPTEGETITGTDLTVSWDGVAATSGDHVHLSLDGGAPVEDLPLSGSYTFTGVSAGGHTVTATVADSSHVAYTNLEATDSVSITLEAATTNSAPVANDDTASVAQGESVVVDVLADDTDAENNIDPTTVQVVQFPTSGSTVVDAVTGAIEYTHDGSATTSDSFTYTVDDDAGATSNVATVTVAVSSTPPPSDLPVTSGLALHLDSEVGVTTSGSAVTTWADQSGNGNDVSTSGGPTLATSPTGAQVVRFDGVDDVASRTGGLTAVPTGSADRTMFVVAAYRDVGYGGVAYGSPQTNRAFGLSVDSNGDLMIQGWGGANDYISTTAGTGAGWFAQSVVYENGAFTHYKDGAAIDSGTHTFATTANRIVVGAEMTPAPYLDMDVAAVVIYDRALSETERQEVEAYLQQTYVGSGATQTASVAISSPAEGETITGTDLTVSWDGVAATSGDHVHLSLDDGPVVEDLPLSGSYTFSGIAEGGHTVTATVADSGHVSYTNPEATDSVSITLEAPTSSTAPVASDDSASVTQGASATVDVLANDADAENDIDPTTVQVTQYPASGTVIVDAVTGAIEYTHDGSASTSDSFAYTVSDLMGSVSNVATVSVSIASAPPSSDLPVTSGLALHLDSEVGVATSGGAVTTWADQSGNGNDLTASGGPTLATSPTGAQVVRFDGVDDVASRTGGLTGVPTGSADRTMFVVAEYRDVGYGGVAYGSPQTNRAFGLSVDPNGDLMIQGWGGANDYISTTAGTNTGWFAQSVVYENSAFTHYKDGTAIDSGTHTFATTANRIVVGAEMTPAPYLDMDVAAVVIYDRALTETERQQVEDYLRQRYVA